MSLPGQVDTLQSSPSIELSRNSSVDINNTSRKGSTFSANSTQSRSSSFRGTPRAAAELDNEESLMENASDGIFDNVGSKRTLSLFLSKSKNAKQKSVKSPAATTKPPKPAAAAAVYTKTAVLTPVQKFHGNRRTIAGSNEIDEKKKKIVGNKLFRLMSADSLEQDKLRCQMYVAILAVAGIVAALIEDFWCFQTCSRDDSSQPCVFQNIPPNSCDPTRVLIIKAVQTVTTLAAVAVLWKEFAIEAQYSALRRHVESNTPLNDVSWIRAGIVVSFIIEILVLVVHCPPGMSFLVSISMQANIAVYRIENLTTSWMLFRLYFVWKFGRTSVFIRYKAKHAASLLFSVKINSYFAIKSAVHAYPISSIVSVSAIFVMSSAYLIRLSEAPLQDNLPGYFWNTIWFIIVTMTSVGYGDYTPTSNIGRFIAVCSMVVGAILSAILTAAVYSNLSFNASEFMTLSFLNSRKWQEGRILRSVVVIQRLWRYGAKHERTRNGLDKLQEFQRQYYDWKQSEPHFGKLLQDAVFSTRELTSKIRNLAVTVRKLQFNEADRLKYVQDCQEAKLKRLEEEKEKEIKEAEEMPSQDMILMLQQLGEQRVIVEQVLRSVIFLSAARQKDNEQIRENIRTLREMALVSAKRSKGKIYRKKTLQHN